MVMVVVVMLVRHYTTKVLNVKCPLVRGFTLAHTETLKQPQNINVP